MFWKSRGEVVTRQVEKVLDGASEEGQGKKRFTE